FDRKSVRVTPSIDITSGKGLGSFEALLRQRPAGRFKGVTVFRVPGIGARRLLKRTNSRRILLLIVELSPAAVGLPARTTSQQNGETDWKQYESPSTGPTNRKRTHSVLRSKP